MTNDLPAVDIAPDVFNSVYQPHLTNTSRIQIIYGGSSSGKSMFVAQRLVYDLMRGRRNYLVCRQVARTLRLSVFAEICGVIVAWGVEHFFSINKSEMLITCVTGCQAALVGLDDVEKLKSIRPAFGAWTDIWVEEATEIERNSIKQLIKRQRGGNPKTKKRITLTFNPILQSHWIYQDYFTHVGWADGQTVYKTPGLSILKTWYVHNKFLTPDDVRDLLDETDKYFRDVYTFGNWGVLGNVIFINWRVEDLSGMRDQFVTHRNGLDFGFSSDPAAMPITHYDRMHKTIYIYDELYERGLTNDILAEEIINRIGQARVVCDSAEPKSIRELQRCGVKAAPARKGRDSVLFGVQWLQQQTIVIDQNCINARNEFQQYKWREDRDGNALREPVDKNNHLIDGLRYAYEDDMEARPKVARSWQG